MPPSQHWDQVPGQGEGAISPPQVVPGLLQLSAHDGQRSENQRLCPSLADRNARCMLSRSLESVPRRKLDGQNGESNGRPHRSTRSVAPVRSLTEGPFAQEHKDQAMGWLENGHEERLNRGVLVRPAFDQCAPIRGFRTFCIASGFHSECACHKGQIQLYAADPNRVPVSSATDLWKIQLPESSWQTNHKQMEFLQKRGTTLGPKAAVMTAPEAMRQYIRKPREDFPLSGSLG